MSTREVELTHGANFGDAQLKIVETDDGGDTEGARRDVGTWTVVSLDNSSGDQNKSNLLPCTVLEPNTIIKVPPMIRQFGDWNAAHFHYQLRLPVGSPISKGIAVQLEARARECVAVALSPTEDFVMGKTYVVHFGASGNMHTVIRRRLPSGHEAVDVTIPSLRVCSMDTWVPYWIALHKGKLYVGVGKAPGKHTLGSLDDTLYHQLRSPVDAVKFVGLGNSVVWKQQSFPLKIRGVVVASVPDSLATILSALPPELPPVDMISVVHNEEDEETKRMLQEYQKECAKQKKRAEKFGIPYKEPSPQAFMQWSTARRLRSNPQKGFITGMDITSSDEVEKQKARAARFGISPNVVRKRSVDSVAGENTPDDTTGVMDAEDEIIVQTGQAWDNLKLTSPHRMDPPKPLWLNPPSEKDVEQLDDYAMEPKVEPVFTPQRIHLCSIDWAAFKQIRTEDIMGYFSIYGPSYVEWLGEISCNVCFEDKFSAARALTNLSTELPSPPPTEEVTIPAATTPQGVASSEEKKVDDGMNDENTGAVKPDLGNMGWRLCQKPIRKRTTDRFGCRGTRARVLMRIATSLDILTEKPTSKPKPPPGFSTKRVLGPGSEYGHRQKRRRRDHGNSKGSEAQWNEESGEDHPLLSRGLSSGRDGYTVEQMQAERESHVVAEVNTTPAKPSDPMPTIHENVEGEVESTSADTHGGDVALST